MAKILVVDDEEHVVRFIKDRLEAAGYSVAVAFDGEEALAKIKTEKPDLILLDIMMPKLDGFEVCRRIKADEETKGIPVTMLTAKTDIEDENRGLNLGIDGYIMKPFDPKLLVEVVANSLAKKG